MWEDERTMTKYSDVNGVAFTDADVESWADEAEAGFPDSTLTIETPTWEKLFHEVTPMWRTTNHYSDLTSTWDSTDQSEP